MLKRRRDSIKFCHNLLLVLLIVLSTGCRPSAGELNGTVLVWHDLDTDQTQVLTQLLDRFVELHPMVNIKATAIPTDELLERYEQAVASALGPDLLLAPSSWIRQLADAGLIDPIDGVVPSELWERYLPGAVETVRYQEHLYGIPESLRLTGLFYNKRQVEQPATTLEELIAQTSQGIKVGMSPDFIDIFWGIQAFGGRLFDENERVILDSGGFINWLAWLKNTQDNPNIILDRDHRTLTTLFTSGEIAYLVDGSWALPLLQTGAAANTVGVAPLPAGPIGPAGPLLETNAFLFNPVSSARQQRVAVQLATFLTNAEQATVLMRRAGRIPTNVQVRVSPSFDPIAYNFLATARNAVPFRNTAKMDAVIAQGNEAYGRVLRGLQGPIEVAQEMAQTINALNGIATSEPLSTQCTGIGVIDLWHALGATDADLLEQIRQSFAADCPAIILRTTAFTVEELLAKLQQLPGAATYPTMVLIPNRWLTMLVTNEAIKPLNTLVDNETLQNYQPNAVESLRVDQRLYGIPYLLTPIVLYYNRALIEDPVRNVDDLLVEGVNGRITALNISFLTAYWGVAAFGGELLREDGRTALGNGGFTAWLTWLHKAQSQAGFLLSADDAMLQTAFLTGEAAYYTAGAEALASLEDAWGTDGSKLGVTRLPTGPVADAAPILAVQGFAITAQSGELRTQLALEFIHYATNVNNQTILMTRSRQIPANVNVDSADVRAIAAFVDQAKTVTIYPNRPEMNAIQEWGDIAYAQVLREGLEPAEVVTATVDAINLANGFGPTLDTTAPITSTSGPNDN